MARAAGSVGDEASALVVLSWSCASATWRRPGCCCASRRAAAAAGNRPLELQARHALGVRARPGQPGRGLHRPRPGDRAGRAQRPGLERLRDRQPGAAQHRPLRAGTRPSGWPARPTSAGRRCRRPPCTSRSAGAVAADGGWPASPLPGRRPVRGYLAGGCEADLVRWQGDPASSELARATLSTQEEPAPRGC